MRLPINRVILQGHQAIGHLFTLDHHHALKEGGKVIVELGETTTYRAQAKRGKEGRWETRLESLGNVNSLSLFDLPTEDQWNMLKSMEKSGE